MTLLKASRFIYKKTLTVILTMLLWLVFSNLTLANDQLFNNFPKATNSTLYENFTPDLLNMYNHDQTNLRAKCEYYKNNAMNYCKKDHSAEYDERQNCILVNKQRWCACMGLRNDCFRGRDFYW